MSFAEIVLRAALTLVGWLVVFVHVLILAVLANSSCGQGAGDILSGSLMMAVPTAICLAVMGAGIRISPHIRWASAPAMLVWPFAVLTVVPLLMAGDTHLCVALGHAEQALARPDWHQYWPWIQTLLLLAMLARFVQLMLAHRATS